MTVSLYFPDDLAAEFGGGQAAAARAQADLAVLYYEKRLVSLGKACEMSGLARPLFERLLGERQVERDYDADDLAEDIAWARGAS